MAAKPTRPVPPRAAKWIQEYRGGQHKACTPGVTRKKSIWSTRYSSDRYESATSQLIGEVETRLGIVIPAVLKEQFSLQNGGILAECCEGMFNDSQLHWTNAVVDGLDPMQSWKRASEDLWFDNAIGVDRPALLIRFASHSESQLCLDYRLSGLGGVPGVSYFDVGLKPTRDVLVAATVDEFVREIMAVG